MDKILALKSGAKQEAEMQTQIEQSLIEINRLNEQMARDQEDIDSLKAHTRANLAEIRTLAVETQAMLEKLKAA